jgi:glycosyltransferase involved in cell wall biosynthesis
MTDGGAPLRSEPGTQLRVALVAAKFLPHQGGVETHVDEVARRLPRGGVQPTVLTTSSERASSPYEVSDGLAVRRFPARLARADLYLSPALVRHVRHTPYDVVHVQGIHTLLAPELLLGLVHSATPSVVTFHTGGNSGRVRHALRSAQWRAIGPLLARASALVAVSRFEADLFGAVVGRSKPIVVIPNGADPLPVGVLDPGIQPGSPLVVSVGRLEWYKGHQRVIAALPELLRQHPGARLVVAGSGPALERLRALAGELGVADHVGFVSYGPGERASLGALVAASDVVALLSSYEAHPVAAMEALGLGKQLVVADCTGLAELAASGLATPVALDARPAVVAQALAAAAEAGPRPARLNLPSWDGCVDRLLEIYRSVVGGL